MFLVANGLKIGVSEKPDRTFLTTDYTNFTDTDRTAGLDDLASVPFV